MLRRDPATGSVVRMNWATYRVTRTQETFDAIPASDPDPVELVPDPEPDSSSI